MSQILRAPARPVLRVALITAISLSFGLILLVTHLLASERVAVALVVLLGLVLPALLVSAVWVELRRPSAARWIGQHAAVLLYTNLAVVVALFLIESSLALFQRHGPPPMGFMAVGASLLLVALRGEKPPA